MNWVAFWHLCWVLFFLNVVTASEHETSSLRPTSLRLPKQRRPLRSNNSIKKGSEGDFKFPDDPLSTTASALSYVSSKKTTNVDYLARNTVPVASATESIRKSHRPPPAHLLAYQAVSSTERGSEKSSEASISPTGWALASLVPSKNSTPSFPKRNVVVSGTAKPFNNYWSSRLRRPAQQTTPITPTDVDSWLETEKTHADSVIPVENLFRDDNNTSNHAIVSKHEHTEAPSAHNGSSSHPTEQINYLEKPTDSESNKPTDETTVSHPPSRKHHGSTSTSHRPTRKHRIENTTESHHRIRSSSRPSHHTSSDTTDVDQNTGNNLIKEVRGSDLGSSILNGIVLATAAAKYAEEAKQENSVVAASETNSTQDNTNSTPHIPHVSTEGTANITTLKSSDEASTVVAVVPDVTHQPDLQETASSVVSRSSAGKGFPTSSESAFPQNITTSPTLATEGLSSASSADTLGEIISSLPISEVTNKMANLLENIISPTTPGGSIPEVGTPPNVSESPESSSHPYSQSPNPESSFEIVNTVTKQMTNAENSTPNGSNASETELVTTTLSNGLIEPRLPSEKHSPSPHVDKSPENSATTLSQEVNDIPEAFTRIKDQSSLSVSSSQGTDNVLLPTSTLPPATSAEPQPKPTSTTRTDIDSTESPRIATPSNIQNHKTPVTISPANTQHAGGSTLTTTTEMTVDLNESTFTENVDDSSLSNISKTEEPVNETHIAATTTVLPETFFTVGLYPVKPVNETHIAATTTVLPEKHFTEDPHPVKPVNETHIAATTTVLPEKRFTEDPHPVKPVNETHIAATTTVLPEKHFTEDPRMEVATTNNDMGNSPGNVETTTQVFLKTSTHRPLTSAAPPKLETVETTPAYKTTKSTTKSHLQTVVTENINVPVDKSDADDDHDETLKYNVTIPDISGKKSNTTEQDPDYNEGDKDEEESDKENEVPTTTTLVIIEEITTTQETTSTTEESAEDDEHHIITEVPAGLDDSELDQSLRLTFEASYKEMCLVRESLTESIATMLNEAATRNIRPSQVRILNLGMTECSSKSLPLADRVPVVLHVIDSDGRGDQNLTDLLYTYLKRGRLNFKYQVSQVKRGVKPFLVEGEDQWSGTVIAAIVASSVAGVSLFCITILLMVMRKRQKGFTSYGQRCTPVSLEDYSLDNISVFNSVRRKAMRASKRSYGNPAFDDPVTVTNPLNFVSLSNMANSHAKIDAEYSEVPTVTVKPDELPPGAECKNRYANVIPIPETRVPLMGSEREDMFINANYVKGAKGSEKFYIACQAPMDSTIADFWMMIWEQQTQVILMLTDLHENGVEKCADYLPPSEVLDCHRVFGDLQVTLKKREVREKYVISSLQLRNLESNLWREVIHMWYTGWPVRGVPDDLTSIIAYLIEARSYSKPGHPVVVHCSPGTGRTGTVIAVDIAIRDFETDRIVDIPKTVYSIRRDRAGAVQTNLQYYLIYQVIHLYATKLAGGGLDSI